MPGPPLAGPVVYCAWTHLRALLETLPKKAAHEQEKHPTSDMASDGIGGQNARTRVPECYLPDQEFDVTVT